MTGLMETPITTSGYDPVRPVSNTTALGDEGLASSRTGKQDRWEKHFRDIEAIDLLKDDWDGDEAIAPPPAVVASVCDLLRILRYLHLPCPTGVGAGPNGSVLIAWQRGRRYFEIDVVGPAKAEWMCREPGLGTRGGVTSGAADFHLMLKALVRVMAG